MLQIELHSLTFVTNIKNWLYIKGYAYMFFLFCFVLQMLTRERFIHFITLKQRCQNDYHTFLFMIEHI